MSLANPTRSRMKINVVELAERNADSDFKKIVLKAIGDTVAKWDVTYANVLVASYIAPRKTAGGILLPDKAMDEDRWQGTVGLVLKLGEGAFKFDGPYEYKGTVPKVGDYVTYFTSDTRETSVKGFSCRYVPDTLIRAIGVDPADIY